MKADTSFMGDYARQLVQRRQNVELRANLDRLAQETATGRVADLAGTLKGDFTQLASFERDLTDLAAYTTSSKELRTRMEASQRALQNVQDTTLDFGGDLIGAQSGRGVGLDVLSSDARGRFLSVVAALNASAAGRSLFAGVATDGPALAPAEDMLAELETAVAAAPDAAAAEAAIRDWFAPGGGFDTDGYLGSTTALQAQTVAPGVALAGDVSADAAAFRDVMAALALAALSDAGPMAGDQIGQRDRLVRAGTSLLAAQAGVSELRSQIGATEARLEEVTSRLAAETDAIVRARALVTDVDVFDRAARLEDAQTQLELLYAITARSARLTLANAL